MHYHMQTRGAVLPEERNLRALCFAERACPRHGTRVRKMGRWKNESKTEGKSKGHREESTLARLDLPVYDDLHVA